MAGVTRAQCKGVARSVLCRKGPVWFRCPAWFRFLQFEERNRVKLTSGMKKLKRSNCSALTGCTRRAYRKPMLKAGKKAYNKYIVKRNGWPKERRVAMNQLEYPHQHTGHASTVSRHAIPYQRVGPCIARRTGRISSKSVNEDETVLR